jgi:hypothetical protein
VVNEVIIIINTDQHGTCSPQEAMVHKGTDKVAADIADSVIEIHV